jgi:hypothetical protein
MGIIPGYLVVAASLGALSFLAFLAMVWKHRKAGILTTIGFCVLTSALITDASTGAEWMNHDRHWLVFLLTGGVCVVFGVLGGLLGRKGKTRTAPPDTTSRLAGGH